MKYSLSINLILVFMIAACTPAMNSKVYYGRAKTYYCKKQYDLAIHSFTQAIESDPLNDKAYVNRGISYIKLENYEMALIDFNKAIEINDQNHRAFCNKGFCFYKMGEYENAISNLEQAVNLKQDHVDAYYRLGGAWHKLGDLNKELSSYLDAININQDYVYPYNAAAWLLATSEELDRPNRNLAIEYAQKAVHLSSNSSSKSQYLDTLAASYAADSKFDLAIESQELAISTWPKSNNVQFLDEMNRRLSLYRNNRKYKE